MADLLSQGVDPTGIMSLLTPFVSGGAISPDTDPQVAGAAATPAWLAFARTMGQAAQPRYGPAEPIGPALANAMSAGYGSALQAEQLPLLRSSAEMSLQQRALDLQRQQFEFGREQAMWNAFGNRFTGQGTPPGAGGPGPQTPPPMPSGFGPPASSQALSALPEIQAIPDTVTRLRVQQTLLDAGASLPAAQQWARQLKVESGFQQTGKDGATLASDKGALGIGQVMPATFTAMAKAHPDITGDINDIGSNLKASYYYFNDGLKKANGNLGGAAAYYVGGDDGLAGWQHGSPSAEVADYVTQTGGAPPPAGAAGGNAGALGPMVQTPFGQVPQNIWTEALFAGAGDPAHFPEIVAGKVNEYQKAQWQPGGPGVQVSPYSGETKPATLGVGSVEILPPGDPRRPASYPPDVPVAMTVNPDGTVKYDIPGGARAGQIGFTRYDTQNSNVMGSSVYKQLTDAETRARGVITGLNADNRTGDVAALESLFRVFDPSAAVTEGKWQIASDIGGYRQTLQDWYSKLSSDSTSRLPPQTRQQIADLMNMEMKNREGQVADYINTTRQNFDQSAQGGDSSKIMAGWQPLWITAADDEAQDLPKGIKPSSSALVATTDANGKTIWKRGSAVPQQQAPAAPMQPAAAQQPTAQQPGTQPPQPAAPTQQPKGSTAPGPAPGQVTPQALRALTEQQLRDFAAGIPPQSGYSEQELGMIAAALRARRG